jgi:hypothetical protein
MKNVYLIYCLIGGYKYVQSVFSSKKKAFANLKEIRLEVESHGTEVNEQDTSIYVMGGIRWTNDNSQVCSTYIAKEYLR